MPRSTSHPGGAKNRVQQPIDASPERSDELRGELARDLHDAVVQPLSALIVGIETWQLGWSPVGQTEASVTAWLELAREALHALRDTLQGVRAHPHAELGLPEALHRYVAPMVRSRGIQFTLDCLNWPSNLPLEFTSTMYLAVREVLTNVERHAHATEVAIVLRGTEKHLTLTIVDNGVGFAPEQVKAFITQPPDSGQRGHHGLRAIHERARLIGGRVRFETAPGCGVRTRIVVPRPAQS